MNPAPINSKESLKTAIQQVKVEITQQEERLGERWERLPKEMLGAAQDALLPIVVKKAINFGGWRLLKLAVNLFYTFRKKRSD